jgi:HEAT repeats
MSLNLALPFESLSTAPGMASSSTDRIALIRDAVAGINTSIPRKRAVQLLQTVNFPEKIQDYQNLLENEDEPSDIRYLAAIGLYKANTPEAIEILIGNSQTRDQNVLAAIMKGLGRIGDERALPAIVRVKNSATGRAASQAAFAAGLLSHRFGLAGNDLRVPVASEYLPPPGGTTSQVRVATPPETEVEVYLRSLVLQPFGIQQDVNHLYQIQCGRNNFMLAFNEAFTHPDTARTIQVRKTLLGVIATKNEETESYATAYLLLTTPAAQANVLDLLIHRSTGELIFSGTAQIKGSSAEFSIRSISRPGAFSVDIAGSFEVGRLQLTNAQSGTIVQERRRPNTSNLQSRR